MYSGYPSVEKFLVIKDMVVLLEETEDNEAKKEVVKRVRDWGFITEEDAINLYVWFES